MTRRAPLLAAPAGLVVVLLTACAPTAREPTDQQPVGTGHVAPAGWSSTGFHGIGLDVPDAAILVDGPWCPGSALPDGDLVVPEFDAGPTSCPAASHPLPSPSPRPATALTVVLTETDAAPGAPSDLPLTDPRTEVVAAAGVTVTASGPTATVDAVLASVRVEARDANGCDQRIDPAVAPRPLDPEGTALLPVVTRHVAVCEYGTTAPPAAGDTAPPSPYWLVASRELPDDRAADVDTRLRAASPAPAGSAVTGTPFGPVLRYLVRGADGNTRVLQSLANVDPQTVTDGHLTVQTGPTVNGSYDPLPTPFDRS